MTWTTPAPPEIPYAEDGDPRALLPATMQAQSERLHELLTSYSASTFDVGSTPNTGAITDIEWGGLPGSPEFTLTTPSLITYTGPTRMFAVSLRVEMGVGEPLRSRAGIGTVSGVWDRYSHFDTGVGVDSQAVHTHAVTLMTLMGPDAVTTLVCGVAAQMGSAVPVGYEAYLDVVSV